MRKVLARLLLVGLAAVAAVTIRPAPAAAYVNYVVGGSTYSFPEVDDQDWGQAVADWALAVSTTLSAVSRSTTTLSIIASNTNYVILDGSTQTKSGTLSVFQLMASSGTFYNVSAASITAQFVVVSSNGFVGGRSTFTAVTMTSATMRGVNYNPPPADGTNGQVLTTNGNGGLSWGGGGGLSNPLSANLDFSSNSAINIRQMQFIATMTALDLQNQVSVASGALAMLIDQSLWVATSANVAASWMYLSSPREVDMTTGAICKWKFSYNDVGGKTTFDLVVPTRTGTHLVAGDFDLNAGTVGFVNRGINGTAAFQAGPSTGVLSIPGEGYASPHAGNSATGRITVMFYVMYFGAPGSNRYLVSRRSPSAYEYGIYLDVTAPPKLHADLLANNGSGVMTAEAPSGSVSTGTWNCIAVSFDKAANVTNIWINKVAQSLINISNVPATTAFNGASLRIGMDSDNGGPANAIIDNVYIFGDHASQTNVNAFCDMKRYP